jgi:hypothetical protein
MLSFKILFQYNQGNILVLRIHMANLVLPIDRKSHFEYLNNQISQH